MSALSAVYGGVVRLRRSWYERRPAARARLPRPVISVGNIAVGGSGKTPVVAALAAVLAHMGHRPAILSRGYGRTSGSGEVVVVGDGRGAFVPVEQSGDEPQMLARETRVPVVVCADRFRAGLTAIERFDSTILILDDGFQHLQLARDVDLVVVSSADLTDRVMPAGRLREPLAAARAADAALVYGDAENARLVNARVGVSRSFFVTRRILPLRPMSDDSPLPPANARVAAVAGIARPERFFDALRWAHAMGYSSYAMGRQFVYPDHYWFTDDDVREIERRSLELGVTAVVTTAKDAVRLDRCRGAMTLPWAILPIDVSIEPGAEFESWLRQRL